jgi:SAM-dependent methyltransferase
VKLTAIDLSSSVISTARKYVSKENPNQQKCGFAQGNVMALPFADETFDVVVTSGVLEYLPLEEGFTELARVIAPGGYFLHLPMRPAVATRFLELLFRFKTHPPKNSPRLRIDTFGSSATTASRRFRLSAGARPRCWPQNLGTQASACYNHSSTILGVAR